MKSLILVSSLLAITLSGCATKSPPSSDCLEARRASAITGDYPLAIRLADACLQNEANSAPRWQHMAYSAKARAYAELKQYNEAIAAKETALVIIPSSRGWDTLVLSSYYREFGLPQKALEIVDANIANNLGENGRGTGFHMPTYYHRGQALYDLGRYQEAIEAFSTGLKDQPDYAWAYWFRGKAYDQLQNEKLARADFLKFSQLVDPRSIEPDHLILLNRYGIKP